jgi:hypothetical protein
MTPSRSPDTEADGMDHAEFDSALEGVVAAARDADVPLDGAYNVRSPRRDVPDYTIEITEQAKRTPDSGD